MAKVAILGFGTVGSGVWEILSQNAGVCARRAGVPVEVGYICDIRDFSAHQAAGLFVNNIEPILQDKDVKVVVETIGGLHPAYEYVRAALESGRCVVTSNKELVAEKGTELMRIAKAHGVCFLFEASVGGGTPVIGPMHRDLAANHILSVEGIVNGTTNFMLTRMRQAGLSFEQALAEAQALGYAETRDPSADVDGIDAKRKIAILASLAFGRHVPPEAVPARGIRAVTPQDVALAAQLGCAVKLVAWAREGAPGRIEAAVEPMLVRNEDLLRARRGQAAHGQRRGGRCGRGPARGGGRARHAVVGPAACGRRGTGRHAPGRYPAALFRRGRGAACRGPGRRGAAFVAGRRAVRLFGARGGARRCARRTGKGAKSGRFLRKHPSHAGRIGGFCV